MDFDCPLNELLSVSNHPALASMSEAELTALATSCRERYAGKLRDEARERDRVKRMEAKARKAKAP